MQTTAGASRGGGCRALRVTQKASSWSPKEQPAARRPPELTRAESACSGGQRHERNTAACPKPTPSTGACANLSRSGRCPFHGPEVNSIPSSLGGASSGVWYQACPALSQHIRGKSAVKGVGSLFRVPKRLPTPFYRSCRCFGLGGPCPWCQASLLTLGWHWVCNTWPFMVEICLHIANVFYLLSFLCLDILWLRALTCAGLALGVVFFTFRPTPLYSCTGWHVIFLVINAVQIRRLIRERRRLTLSDEQRQIGEAAFQSLSREDLLTLLTRAIGAGSPPGLDLRDLCRQPLTTEERALRDIAFSRLSRKELLNLLVRRLWQSLRPPRLTRWWARRPPNGATMTHAAENLPASRPSAADSLRCQGGR